MQDADEADHVSQSEDGHAQQPGRPVAPLARPSEAAAAEEAAEQGGAVPGGVRRLHRRPQVHGRPAQQADTQRQRAHRRHLRWTAQTRQSAKGGTGSGDGSRRGGKIRGIWDSKNRLQTAKEMGADYTLNSKDPETSQKIISLCNNKGADSVVDFVNAPPTAKLGISVLRKRGNLVLVALFGGSIELSLVTIPLKSIVIQGAYTGNYHDMVELLDLTRKGTINPIITKRYPLSEANNALEDLKARKILGRAVINP